MKLGVAYNVFDGTELLGKSIESIRPHVDFICAIFQRLSNHGEAIDTDFVRLFKSLKVDYWELYTPNLTQLPSWNEIAKRNRGLEICAKNDCKIFQTMDCDEVYKPEEYGRAKEKFIRSGSDASACQMQTYYKTTKYRFDPPEEYYVPLFYRLDGRRFREPTPWVVTVDPTRKLPSNNVLLFDRFEIEMHHLSWIRDDIGRKIRNSSAKRNWSGQVQAMIDHYRNWKPGDKAYCAGDYFNLSESKDEI